MTLDAGGTNFRFAAMRGHKPVTRTVALPSNGDNLDRCLANIGEGFARVKKLCPKPPVAISFAFPGPADYPNGIIGDLGNLPGFRGGVALGPMLEEKFGLPVCINNDGDLFAYGEAIAGFLPYVNGLLKKAGSPKRYNNLFGVTLGTGFGGGIVRRGELFVGDNSIAGEVWLLRHKLHERGGRGQHPRCPPRLCGESRFAIRSVTGAEGHLRDRPRQCAGPQSRRARSLSSIGRSRRRRVGPRPDAGGRIGGGRRRTIRGGASLFTGADEGVEQHLHRP
jgi:predicted NBD/HSP70 family sugar kinase